MKPTEKICPMMSRPRVILARYETSAVIKNDHCFVTCQGEKCTEWKPCLVRWAVAEGDIADMIDTDTPEGWELKRNLEDKL